jgi:predicted nucleic acid-binding protein
VTRYLLDTNIISNATKVAPSEALLSWLGAQADEDLFISTFSIAEIWRGILEKDEGKKRRALEDWFAGAEGPQNLFAGRVLGFDEQAALVWGRLMADGRELGQPRSAIDMMIAAVAIVNGCVVATDNERHFHSVVEFFNPLKA